MVECKAYAAHLPGGSSQSWPQVWTDPASQLVDVPCGETTRQQTRQVPLTTYAGGNHPGVYTPFVQKLSLTYYTHNYLWDSPVVFCV
jgi:hypothetical protein